MGYDGSDHCRKKPANVSKFNDVKKNPQPLYHMNSRRIVSARGVPDESSSQYPLLALHGD